MYWLLQNRCHASMSSSYRHWQVWDDHHQKSTSNDVIFITIGYSPKQVCHMLLWQVNVVYNVCKRQQHRPNIHSYRFTLTETSYQKHINPYLAVSCSISLIVVPPLLSVCGTGDMPPSLQTESTFNNEQLKSQQIWNVLARQTQHRHIHWHSWLSC